MAVLRFFGRMIVSLIVGLAVVLAAIALISAVIHAAPATQENAFFIAVLVVALIGGYSLIYGGRS